jgi:hypothetical protein
MRIFILLVALLTCFLSAAQENTYQEPVIIAGDSRNPVTGTFSDVVQAKVMLKAGALGMSGFTNFGQGDIYYVLISNTVGSFNLTTKQYLGSWPLGKTLPECAEDVEVCNLPWWNGRWGTDEFVEAPFIQRNIDYSLDESFKLATTDEEKSAFGCLTQHPLRYGDMTGDTTPELIVIFKNGLAVFSPEKKKTIFSFIPNIPDSISWEELRELGLSLGLDKETTPQYGSLRLYEEANTTSIAHRGYAKLYVGHFASETSNDLVVWRKFYESRLKSDAVKGFKKVSDTFVHYKLIDGEYKKQATESDTVKGWLTSKNLTWKKGYPSKSECAGQEGQFIPEMHDVLLNDPEVLQ